MEAKGGFLKRSQLVIVCREPKGERELKGEPHSGFGFGCWTDVGLVFRVENM